MAQIFKAHRRELDELSVKRLLPQARCRMVGPFVFLDHMGPADFSAGSGIDVRPHPHIGLSTLSYLFEGSMLHRDSLGNTQEILPGDVNWMTAGSGIVHSERETLEVRSVPHRLNGIQCWVALPENKTEIEPNFYHHKSDTLPCIYRDKTLIRVVAGEAYGYTSPVVTYSPLFYLDVIAKKGAVITRPYQHYQTALYIQMGEVEINQEIFSSGDFVVLDDNDLDISVTKATRFIMLGGEKFQNQPHLDWNFLAFTKERIEQAKQDWKAGRFPQIPSDKDQFIALP